MLFLPFWERRTLVRHVFSFSRRALSLASLSSVFSVRNLFFDLWNERKPGYRAVAKRRNAYAAMPSPEAYRAVAKRKGAYAAMPVWGYRGVTEGTPRSSFCSLYTAMMSGYRAVAKRRSAYAAMPSPEAYRAVAKRRCAYAAMPSHKILSRSHEKEERLRRATQ